MADRRSQLAGINLNLFPVLDAMLRHRSVTRASRELGVTPSAVSHALRELRVLLDDPLFVRSGTGMMPTRRATDIEVALREGLGHLSDVVQRRPEFDPSSANRVFTIATSDEQLMVVLPAVFERLQRVAPNVGLNVRPRAVRAMEMLETGETDLLLRLTGEIPSWAASETLDSGAVVCLVRSDHPSVQDELTLEQYASLPHVRISPQGFGSSSTERHLATLGIEREVMVYTSSFATAPEFVACSNAVLTLPESVARYVASRLGLRVLKPPFDAPGFVLDMVWHQSRDDAALRWLRRVLVEETERARAAHAPKVD